MSFFLPGSIVHNLSLMKRAHRQLLLAVLLLGPLTSLQPAEDVRQLSFYHTHTSEKLSVTYFSDGQYVASSLAELNLETSEPAM